MRETRSEREYRLAAEKAKRAKRRRRIAAWAVFALVLIAVALYFFGVFGEIFPARRSVKQGQVGVTFLSVGQGDSCVIQDGDIVVVIDTGDAGCRERLVAALHEHGVKRIDYLILTHPHADHIGGARALLAAYPVERILFTTIPDRLVPSNATYRTLMDDIARRGIMTRCLAVGDMIELDGAHIEVLSPHADDDYDGLNNYSLVLRLVFGKTAFLLMGDAEFEVEAELVYMKYNLVCDVIKIGHHGSRYSTSPLFLARSRADYAVISCGKGNSYGYPHAAVIQRLDDAGIEIFRTDACGDIRFVSNGKAVRRVITPLERFKEKLDSLFES